MLKHLNFMRSAALAALLASPLSAEDAIDADTVVATVNGQPVTIGQMIMVRASLPQQYLSLPDDVLFTGILDQIIQQNVLAQEHEGDEPRRLRIALESERRLILADSVVETFLSNPVTDAEIQTAYDAKYAGFEGPKEFNASHILVGSKAEADTIREELVAGADFAEMAKTKSTGPSGPSGGELGWFGPGAMVPEFETATMALQVGEISQPVATQFGWHLIILNDTRVQETPSLDEVRGELVGEIQGQRLEDYVASLTGKATIERSQAEGVDPAIIKQTSLLDG